MKLPPNKSSEFMGISGGRGGSEAAGRSGVAQGVPLVFLINDDIKHNSIQLNNEKINKTLNQVDFQRLIECLDGLIQLVSPTSGVPDNL